MLHCDLRVRWKVASDLRFRAAISEPETHSFCGISGDLAPSTRKSLAIAIVRFWYAKLDVSVVAGCFFWASQKESFCMKPTMRAEMIAYMIYLEGPEYHKYVMHIFYLKYSGTPKYGNMLGNSLPDWASWSCPRNNRKSPKIFGFSTIKEYVMHHFLHEVFPGILQVIVSNGMVLPKQSKEHFKKSCVDGGQ